MTLTPSPEPATKDDRFWRMLAMIYAMGLLFFTLAPSFFTSTTSVRVSGGREVLQEQIDSLSRRVGALESRAGDQAVSNPVTASDSAKDANASALARLQSDVMAMSAAMAALQAEVKATGASAVEARQTSAALIGSAIAFAQLRDAAASGRAFGDELALMREASKQDAVLQGLATKFEPYVAGVPTLAVLHDELLQREPAVAVVIAKGSAHTWWQRVLAELKGLVTVRPVHGGEGDALAGLEASMAQGSAAALDAFKNLPTDAQNNLADWQKRLEARQQVDAVLRDMTTHFVAEPQGKTP